MQRAGENGVALIMTLILLAVISVMAVSFMFLSQSETWSTMNYRLMSQARVGAEAGVNSAANFLLNNNTGHPYTPPNTASVTPNDPITGYTLTNYPVRFGGNPVVLSADNSVSANYQYSAVQSDFNTSAVGKGSISAGDVTVNYSTTATLLSMRLVVPYGSTTPQTIQSWLITSNGTVTGANNAQVQVSAVLERPITPTFSYAAFGTSPTCSALDLSGVGHTDSYDSTVGSAVQNYGGNVGTNGNLTTVGSGTVYGSLSTPRSGVGTCESGSVTAYEGNLSQVTQGIVELPQNVVYDLPALPNPLPPLRNDSVGPDCNGVPGCIFIASKNIQLPPGDYGRLDVNSQTDVHLSAGTYNLNSIKLNGNSNLVIDSGPVTLNVAGCNSISGSNCASYVSEPIELEGGSIANSSLNPLNLQILYAGPEDIEFKGGAQASALIFAPNAEIELSGGGDFYGAMIGGTVSIHGNGALHYDRNLQNTAPRVGNFLLQSFTWAKY